MFLYETHVHTSSVSACAASTPAEQVRAYKARGYTGIIITDHFFSGNIRYTSASKWDKKIEFFASGYNEAKKAGDKIGLDVFFGWEYTIYGQDFLTYGLGLDFLLANPRLERTLRIEEYSRLVRASGGYLAQAHPFRQAFWITSPRAVNPAYIDGVEVINCNMTDDCNAMAYKFAKKHSLPMQAGTDSHEAEMYYGLSGIRLSKRANNIHEIIKEIKSGDAELILPY